MQRDYRGVLISITTQSVSGGYAVSFTLTIPDDDGSGSLTLSRSISHVFAEDGEALGDALMQAKREIDEQYALDRELDEVSEKDEEHENEEEE